MGTPSSSSSRFCINAKNYFLTYSRCPISKEIVLDQIKNFSFPVNLAFIRVCQEQHSDGDNHLHCLLQFSGKYKCRNPRFFDIINPDSDESFHPNIQSARSANDVADYITKGGSYIDHGQFQEDGRKRKCDRIELDVVYNKALSARSKTESLEIIRKNDPRTFYLQHHNISANADRLFPEPIQEYLSPFDPQSFVVPQELQYWVTHNIFSPESRPYRTKSLILEGPSRSGKTLWARSLGPHNYMFGYLDFNSKLYSNNAWYNIIDDVSPSYLQKKHWKELIGVQHNWVSNVKYGKPIQIKGGIPSIVLCNPGSEEYSYKTFLDKDANSSLKIWTETNAEFFFAESAFYRSEASAMQTEETSSDQA
ncbi:replicase [Olea europaea geminivirus]|nr:replication-associated protein [Olea europaea geminivirus]QTH79682.1 replication-associated protein [Olea europaea geminivirus]QTH79690.1 replication-associated protein [Olea europaea geminivirus]QTH79698.1 replication-associated protein [Olea europaea geminivirus]QTH79702.1 replication-associated protein [Olea europaea geminivirus]